MIYRRYSVPSAWEEIERMSKLVNSFAGGRPREAGVFPAMNAWTTEDEEVVTAEMPGVVAADLEISIANDVLTISGERGGQQADATLRYHRRERVAGKFSRSIQLSFPVNSDQVAANLENGVLTIRLPRAEADKPRKIAIKAS